jgi:FKBP-type peptidyl-prolyl cis-trans isomerase
MIRHARAGAFATFFGLIALLTPRTDAGQPSVAPSDVAAAPADAIRTASGVAMTVIQAGSGIDRPRGDDCVIVRFTGWKRDGSLFSTSGLHGETSTQCLTAAIPGIAEALRAMTPGEKRRIWVPAELAFAPHAHHGTKAMPKEPAPKMDLTFEVELVQILKAPEKPFNLKVPPRSVFRTPSGVAMMVLQPGAGTAHPKPSSRVTLNYTGWTADGVLFESTVTSGHPAVFLLGTTLAGWREGLQYMVAGEKARLWIPAALAYGARPADKLVPAGDLVYDIELIDFQ